jgi:hypothetical protein
MEQKKRLLQRLPLSMITEEQNAFNSLIPDAVNFNINYDKNVGIYSSLQLCCPLFPFPCLKEQTI